MFRRPLLALGMLLCCFGALELAFGGVEFFLQSRNWQGFIVSAIVASSVGAGLMLAFWQASGDKTVFDPRSAFFLTVASWTVVPVITALPLYFASTEISFTDAVFETTSGLTTTGSTVLSGLDSLDPAFLLWRSILQWIGGVGIILMAIVMLPFLRIGGMQLFKVESSSHPEGNLIDRPTQLIQSIAYLYGGLTLFCMSAYALAGMTTFDALNHAMTTVSTGGFSTHDASIGYFGSPAIEWVSVVFMAAGAMPFVLFLRLVAGDVLAFLKDPQAPVFLMILLVVSVAVAIFLAPPEESPAEALRHAAFNVTSIVTTSGYTIGDYQEWGPGAIGVFFALTFFGGCAGSTAGGVKVYRFQLLRIFAAEHLRRLHSPSLVEVHNFGGVKLTNEIRLSVLAFLSMFVGAYSLGAVALTLTGVDLVTALSASATALCNVGPGLGDLIGPADNFATIPDAAKWVLTALMLLGRLELFALLVMFDPYFWR